jgi:hypothetical protein
MSTKYPNYNNIIEIDPTALKKNGLIGGKLLTSQTTTQIDGSVIESSITKIDLEKQIISPYSNSRTLDARITTLENTPSSSATATGTVSNPVLESSTRLGIAGTNVQANLDNIATLLAYSTTYSGHSKQSSFGVNFAIPSSVSANMSGINNTGSYKGYKKIYNIGFPGAIPFDAPVGYTWVANVNIHVLISGGNVSAETLRFNIRSRGGQVLNDDDFEQSIFIPKNQQIEADLNTNGKIIVGTIAGNLNLGFELFAHVQSSDPDISANVDFGDPTLDFTLYLTKIL